uniref:Putative secreted protein n=1 Tax=Ixodes ricinus TaxID=34613 RepID=A0A6B0UW18_IXORI
MGHWSVGPSRTRRKCRSVWSSSGFWLRTLGAAAHLSRASASPDRVAAAVKAKKESAGGTPRSRRRCSSCRATPTRCRAFSSCVSEKDGQPGLLARRSTRLSTPSMTSHWSRLTTVAKGRANSGGQGGGQQGSRPACFLRRSWASSARDCSSRV